MTTRSKNRFVRHRKKTVAVILVLALLLIELCSNILIRVKGHHELRRHYPFNRVISGYTVYRNTPHYDFRLSTIRGLPDEPDAQLDAHGFLSDSPVSVAKPDGVVRVFLLGGSAAFSAGQTDAYGAVHKYPWGVYVYRLSIAGYLKQYLAQAFPTQRFEVITAAAYERKFHQSFLSYLEVISRFSPDYVVNMEGWNDVSSIVSGTPYADAEAQLKDYIELWNRHYEKPLIQRTSTYYVLSKLIDRAKRNLPEVRAETSTCDPADFTQEAYQDHRAEYVANADRFLQILRQYSATVRADDAKMVFVLQPMLLREGHNKRLSNIEQALAEVVPFQRQSPELTARSMQVARYFFDDYLADAMAKSLEGSAEFIDLNEEIEELGPAFEMYTDYCHLTPEGNRYVAEVIGKRIAAQSSSWVDLQVRD